MLWSDRIQIWRVVFDAPRRADRLPGQWRRLYPHYPL